MLWLYSGKTSKLSRTEKKIDIRNSVLEHEAQEYPSFPPTAQEHEGPKQERRGKHITVAELNLKFISLDFLETFN